MWKEWSEKITELSVNMWNFPRIYFFILIFVSHRNSINIFRVCFPLPWRIFPFDEKKKLNLVKKFWFWRNCSASHFALLQIFFWPCWNTRRQKNSLRCNFSKLFFEKRTSFLCRSFVTCIQRKIQFAST